METCCQIYRLNEPGRFPPDYIELFQEALAGPQTLFVVAELEDKIVALGGVGLSPYGPLTRAALSYGLVHPDVQHRGIGTALLFASIALLRDQPTPYMLSVSPVAESRSFFTQFGFHFLNRFTNKRANLEFELLGAWVAQRDRSICRNVLHRSSVKLDVDEDIPRITLEEANAGYTVR